MSVVVADPHAVAADPAMPFVGLALDSSYMQRRLRSCLGPAVELQAIRVSRWKPGRRCVIEYEIAGDADAAPSTLLGKVRAKSFDRATYALMNDLAGSRISVGVAEGASVPAVRGAVPECHMWLQDKVAGVPGWQAIAGRTGAVEAHRIGSALATLHRALPPLPKRHTAADEMEVLGAAFDDVLAAHGGLDGRLRAVQRACEQHATALPDAAACGIHRDFYHDQLLAADDRVWILDLDTAAEGDAALDVGNFTAHLAEQSLRLLGGAHALAREEAAFIAGFRAAGGEARDQSIEIYKTLSLARHISISARFESRRPFTHALLRLCEDRLQL